MTRAYEQIVIYVASGGRLPVTAEMSSLNLQIGVTLKWAGRGRTKWHIQLQKSGA